LVFCCDGVAAALSGFLGMGYMTFISITYIIYL
jgi:hypothetical protein